MATTSNDSDLAYLLQFGRPEELRQLLDRTPDVLKRMLSTSERLPLPLVDAVLTIDGPALRWLASNQTLMATDAPIRSRLAASGHPLVAEEAFYRDVWQLPELRALMAAADPTDPRWLAKPLGPVRQLTRVRADTGDRHRWLVLRAAVVSPFPDLVTHALREHLPHGLTRAERLRGLLSLARHGGPAALRALVALVDIRQHLGNDLDLARQAVTGPDGVAALAAATEAAEGPTGLIDELYEPPEVVTHALAVRPELNWSAVLTAHETRPLAPAVVERLVARTDCPADSLPALCAGHPRPAGVLAAFGGPVPIATLVSYGKAKGMKALLAETVRKTIGREGHAAELLAVVRPAAVILEALHAVSATGAAGRRRAAELTDLLAGLVADRLGTEAAAWRVVRQRLGTFRGTVDELLSDAATRAERGEGTDGAWPDSAPAPGFADSSTPFGERSALKGSRAAFLTLLDAANPAVQWSLLPYLDGRTSFDLLTSGRWRPEWLEWALAAPDNTERVLLARRRDLPADAVTALAVLDDPAINVHLVYQRTADWELRLALATGRPLTPGSHDRLPNHAEVMRTLPDIVRKVNKKMWLGPWVASGDSELLRVCVDNVSLSSIHLQWRFVLGLWERQGPEGLPHKLPAWFESRVLSTVHSLVQQAGQADALRQVREMAAEQGSAKHLARRMRQTDRDLDWLIAEGFAWDWDALRIEHIQSSLPAWRCAELAALDGCPQSLTEPNAKLSRSEQTAHQRLAGGEPVATVLPRAVLSMPDTELTWASAAAHNGVFAWSDLVEYGRPARAVLATVARERTEDHAREIADLMRTLVDKHLCGNAEAWVLAIRMLPDFPGSLPQLAETAALATLSPSTAG